MEYQDKICSRRKQRTTKTNGDFDNSVFVDYPTTSSPTTQRTPSPYHSDSRSRHSRSQSRAFSSSEPEERNYMHVVDPLSSFITSTPNPDQKSDSFLLDRPSVTSPFTPYGNRSELDSTFSDSQPRDPFILDKSSPNVKGSPNVRASMPRQRSSNESAKRFRFDSTSISQMQSPNAENRSSPYSPLNKLIDSADPSPSFYTSTPNPDKSTSSYRSNQSPKTSPRLREGQSKSKLSTSKSGSSYLDWSELHDDSLKFEDLEKSREWESYSNDEPLTLKDLQTSHDSNPYLTEEPEKRNIFVNSKVTVLDGSTFDKFLSPKYIALVMFYNSRKVGDPSILNVYKQQFIGGARITTKANSAYAAVDCALHNDLCLREDMKTALSVRLYHHGKRSGTIDDPKKDIRPSNLKAFIDNWSPIPNQCKDCCCT